jgi:hypothetical protein
LLVRDPAYQNLSAAEQRRISAIGLDEGVGVARMAMGPDQSDAETARLNRQTAPAIGGGSMNDGPAALSDSGPFAANVAARKAMLARGIDPDTLLPMTGSEAVPNTRRTHTAKNGQGPLAIAAGIDADQPYAVMAYMAATKQMHFNRDVNRWMTAEGREYNADLSRLSPDELAEFNKAGRQMVSIESRIDMQREQARLESILIDPRRGRGFGESFQNRIDFNNARTSPATSVESMDYGDPANAISPFNADMGTGELTGRGVFDPAGGKRFINDLWRGVNAAVNTAAEPVAQVIDMGMAAVGVGYTALTGKSADMPMISFTSKAVAAGATTEELAHAVNPVYSVLVAGYEAKQAVERGDAGALYELTGALAGGAAAFKGATRMPGFEPGVFSAGTKAVASDLLTGTKTAFGGVIDDMATAYMSNTGMLLRAVPDGPSSGRTASTVGLSSEDAPVLQGDASRARIVQQIGEGVQPTLQAIWELDPDARVGFRGSLASGMKNDTKLGPNGERVAFDGFVSTKGGQPYTGPQGYDVDYFIVSDKLADQLGNKWFMDAADLPGEPLRSPLSEFKKTLSSDPGLSGMKPGKPEFRVFSEQDMTRRIPLDDPQYYFIP